ncbi:MAG: PIN domain-containing protein [Acidobacteria bacterium]|jgi:predicted nucleic acid-binding protein|nr:PIN domain-containing protein [Acidobacteriota bacterium]
MAIVVDTDIVSYIFKKDTRSELYEPHLIQVPKFISFMTFAELRRWKFQSNWSEIKNKKFEKLLSDYGVVYADEELCNLWARITINAQKKGRPIETADAWVAAAALMFDVPLITHNRKHFENVENLKIISES